MAGILRLDLILNGVSVTPNEPLRSLLEEPGVLESLADRGRVEDLPGESP